MASKVIAIVVAFLHVYFLALEMFFWTEPLGLKAFRNTLEKALQTKVLAANQGLYNGFLAVGLLWSVFHPNLEFALQIRGYFFLCVLVAGIYGAYSVSRKIFFIQGLPALVGLIFLGLQMF